MRLSRSSLFPPGPLEPITYSLDRYQDPPADSGDTQPASLDLLVEQSLGDAHLGAQLCEAQAASMLLLMSHGASLRFHTITVAVL